MSNGVRRTAAAGLKASAGSNVSKRYKQLSKKYKAQGSAPGQLMQAYQSQKMKPSGGQKMPSKSQMQRIGDAVKGLGKGGISKIKPYPGTGFGRRPGIKRPIRKPKPPLGGGFGGFRPKPKPGKPFQKPGQGIHKIQDLLNRDYNRSSKPQGMQLARRKSVKRKSMSSAFGKAAGAMGRLAGSLKGSKSAKNDRAIASSKVRGVKENLGRAGQAIKKGVGKAVSSSFVGQSFRLGQGIGRGINNLRARRGIKKLGKAAGAASGAFSGAASALRRK